MAFRALLFTKHLETNTALTAACKSAGILLEICDDIFSAIEKGTKQQFSCVMADWSSQPESGFLMKRARESASNAKTVAIAIVEREPSAAEMRNHRLDFLIYRPIKPQEADEVLAKALERMPSVTAAKMPEIANVAGRPESKASEPFAADRVAASGVAASGNLELNKVPNHQVPDYAADPYFGADEWEEGSPQGVVHQEKPRLQLSEIFSWQLVVAVALALGAALCVWHARDTLLYLARTRENRKEIFHESVTAFFSLTPPVPSASGTTGTSVPLDAYVTQATKDSNDPVELKVIPPQAEVSNSGIELHRHEDMPLAAPVNAAPSADARKVVPDSLRGASPITPPTVVTVSPAQMMPVSIPVPSPTSGDQVSEPVMVSEEAERALLVSSVAPVYPPEAASQKAQGPVVLQAIIGRDGTVEDLKIVRGSFVLSKAAIAAVKQWRFQPYRLNGHAAQTQTLLTINFAGPA